MILINDLLFYHYLKENSGTVKNVPEFLQILFQQRLSDDDLFTLADIEALGGFVYTLTVQVVVNIRFANGIDRFTEVCRTVTIAACAAKERDTDYITGADAVGIVSSL